MATEKLKNIRITPRDQELLTWINAAGFVSNDHISMWLGVATQTAYRRTRLLVQHQYLRHEKVLANEKGVYTATLNAKYLCGFNVPLLKKFPLGSFKHDLLVTSVCLSLAKQHHCSYTTERELRHEKGQEGVGIRGHTADGILHLTNDKDYAIEVELNAKGLARREKIMKHYQRSFAFEEVWYFCGSTRIAKHMVSYKSKLPFLKVFLLTKKNVSDIAWEVFE